MRLAMLVSAMLFVFVGAAFAADPATQPAAQPSKKTVERSEKLLADVKNFVLKLTYHGEQDKPYYNLTLSVPIKRTKEQRGPFDPFIQITEDQAKKIIAQLVEVGFFDVAMDGNRNASPAPPEKSYYTLQVITGEPDNQVVFEEWLVLGPAMFPHLDGLRKALDGDAATQMDLLLGRLSGERKKADAKPKER